MRCGYRGRGTEALLRRLGYPDREHPLVYRDDRFRRFVLCDRGYGAGSPEGDGQGASHRLASHDR